MVDTSDPPKPPTRGQDYVRRRLESMYRNAEDPAIRAEYPTFPSVETIEIALQKYRLIVTATVSTPSVVPSDGAKVSFIWSKNGWDLTLDWLPLGGIEVWGRERASGRVEVDGDSAGALLRFIELLGEIAIKPATDPGELHRYEGDEDWPQTAKTFAERIRAENGSLIDQLADRDRPMRFSPDFTDIEGSHVFVQWKGTDVRLTFHCECGERGHFHGDFAYALRCGACGTEWEMPHSWALVPVHRADCIQDVEMDPSDDADVPPESH